MDNQQDAAGARSADLDPKGQKIPSSSSCKSKPTESARLSEQASEMTKTAIQEAMDNAGAAECKKSNCSKKAPPLEPDEEVLTLVECAFLESNKGMTGACSVAQIVGPNLLNLPEPPSSDDKSIESSTAESQVLLAVAPTATVSAIPVGIDVDVQDHTFPMESDSVLDHTSVHRNQGNQDMEVLEPTPTVLRLDETMKAQESNVTNIDHQASKIVDTALNTIVEQCQKCVSEGIDIVQGTQETPGVYDTPPPNRLSIEAREKIVTILANITAQLDELKLELQK